MTTIATSPHASADMNHVLANPQAPRAEWKTLCGRNASGWNTCEGNFHVGSAYSCGRCVAHMTAETK